MMGAYLDDAFNSWLGEAWSCCAPTIKRHGDINKERSGVEKHMTILHDQPRLVPPPSSDPPGRASSSRELLDRSHNYASNMSKRAAFSVRRKLNAYNGIRSRRPQIGRPMQISDPSDFKHVGMAIPRRTDRFRPLQLSIYLPENQLSPILPHFQEFDDDESILTYPPQAIMTHSRSTSAMSSFTIPRKPLNYSISRLERRSARNSVDEHESPTSTSSEWALQPLKPRPRIPESPSTQELMAALEAQLPRAPPAARLRNIGEPPPLVKTAEQYGRVKSALIEREELESQLRKLDTIIEQRRSLYLSRSSRGTSIYNQAQEPSPPTPKFPNTREVSTPVQVDERPQTAPGKPAVRIPHGEFSFTGASAAFNSHPPISRGESPQQNEVDQACLRKALPTLPSAHYHNPNFIPPSRPHSSRSAPAPPPPLPLMLHSPLPKSRSVTPRKSFTRSRSRVSNWLFRSPSSLSDSTNGEERDRHRRTVSNDSITNSPKPVTSKEGFYQCIDLNAPAVRMSFSDRSLSTVMTEERSFISGDDGVREVDRIFDESEAEADEDEGTRTLPTTNWSAQSSPGRMSDVVMRKEMEFKVGRMRSFEDMESMDEKELDWEGRALGTIPNRTSVGVAF